MVLDFNQFDQYKQISHVDGCSGQRMGDLVLFDNDVALCSFESLFGKDL